jgi:curved DNA-binding protein CbpA
MASRRSLYDVLNVSPDAEPVVIEAAYRALMKKYHPDQAAAAGATESQGAAEINQAFAVLRDAERRADYDSREATRQQAFRLVPAPALPPQRGGAFGWAGWLVAFLLGALLYVTINGRGGIVQPPAKTDKDAAASAEPDLRSQPTAFAPASVAETRPSDVDREILAGEARRLQGTVAAPAEEDPAALLVEERPAASAPSAAPPPRQRSRTKRRAPGQPADRAEEDFLAREGYIY